LNEHLGQAYSKPDGWAIGTFYCSTLDISTYFKCDLVKHTI